MPNSEKALKGILKSLNKINDALGTVAGNDLAGDVQALITSETATNVILDTAVAGEATSNAILDTLATAILTADTAVDLIVAIVGTGPGGISLADQTVLLEAQLE